MQFEKLIFDLLDKLIYLMLSLTAMEVLLTEASTRSCIFYNQIKLV